MNNNKRSILSLYELNNRVREAIEGNFDEEYWVKAELSEVRVSLKRHCFVELVQTDDSHLPVAKARGVIMNSVYPLLKMNFEETTGQPFQTGLQVLLKVRLTFSEVYGYSLIVTDIDPTFTLGEMVRRRKEILDRLERDGVLHLNQELTLDEPLNRIAVISSPTAAGYGDFCHQLENNVSDYRFEMKLFPALMQGEQTEKSIIQALDNVANENDKWQAVVIIRGGGATSDLSSFETFELANHIAQFSLPVIIGIGHERDTTVLDYVAHTHLKTPTAVADFLIEGIDSCAERLNVLYRNLYDGVCKLQENQRQRIVDALKTLQQFKNSFFLIYQTRLKNINEHLNSSSHQNTTLSRIHIENCENQLKRAIHNELTKEKLNLSLIEQNVQLRDPALILKRGYSMTLKNGHIVKDASTLQAGDCLITRLAQGQVSSTVDNIKSSE